MDPNKKDFKTKTILARTKYHAFTIDYENFLTVTEYYFKNLSFLYDKLSFLKSKISCLWSVTFRVKANFIIM